MTSVSPRERSELSGAQGADPVFGNAFAVSAAKLIERFLAIPRPAKRAIAVVLDIAICYFVTVLAFYLRLGDWVAISGHRWAAVVVSVLLSIPLFAVSGLYRAIFRYSDNASLLAISKAILVYGVIYAGLFTFVQIDGVPRTVGFIQPLLLFVLIASSRVLAGWVLGGSYLRLLSDEQRQTVLIYGAGTAGRQLLKSLQLSDIRVVAFIDDDEHIRGQLLMGRPVFGPAEIPRLAQRHRLTDVLLAIPSASRRRRQEIVDMIRPMAITVRTVPGMDDVARGRITIDDLRPLEIEDLLGRDTVAPDPTLLRRTIAGKTVMVTGSGGSIGSELCRQIVAQGPLKLLLIEMSEAALYAIHQELIGRVSAIGGGIEIIPLLASTCDQNRMRAIIGHWSPNTIFHAAAYKHVPLVEYNPVEGIRNNVFGTLRVAETALLNQVQDLVLISTDKAVRPTNVMGASKRLAEQCLQALAAEKLKEATRGNSALEEPSTGPARTRFSMVRFGNVLGSSGSVVPLFRRQIRDGGPITITHADITRYFMTIPEAAELVIQAGAMASGGEVYVLDMGEPVRIRDLACAMVSLSGLTVRDEAHPEGDIEILEVGLRPGEKLFEELLIGNSPLPTSHPRIMRAREPFIAWPELEGRLRALEKALIAGDRSSSLSMLSAMVPEYEGEQSVREGDGAGENG